jgi:hypothetical protein
VLYSDRRSHGATDRIVLPAYIDLVAARPANGNAVGDRTDG